MKKKWLLFILLIVIKNISSAQMQIECQEAEYRGSEGQNRSLFGNH